MGRHSPSSAHRASAVRSGSQPRTHPGDHPHDASLTADHQHLERRFRRGLGLSFVNTVVTRLANFSLGILLARLLAPEEFGLYAIALVVLNLLYVFCDFGGAAALIRHSGDVRQMIPTVWTFSLFGSALTYLACFGAAPWIAAGFGSPESTDLIRVLSLNVILSGIGIVPAGMLMRDMHQGKRLIADLAGTTLTLAVTGVLAITGLGVWSLVIGNCVGTALVVILLLAATREYPRLGWATRYVDEILRIGLAATTGSLLLVMLISVPQVVTGSLLGITALGFYYLAFNVSNWPVQIATATLQRVILPLFSRIRDAGRSMDDAASAVIARVLAVCLPASAALALLAEPIVRVLYGSRWLPASVVLSALAIAALVRILSEVVGDLLLAIGAAGLSVVVNVVWLIAAIPATVVAGNVWGLAGVAWAQVVVAMAVSVPANIYALRRADLNLRRITRQVWPALTGLPIAIVALLVLRLTESSDWVQLIVGVGVYAGASAVSWRMIARHRVAGSGGWLGGAVATPQGQPLAGPPVPSGSASPSSSSPRSPDSAP